MDRWILSFTQSLLTFVREEMTSEWGGGGREKGQRGRETERGRKRVREGRREGGRGERTILATSFLPYLHVEYRLYTVVPRLVRFIDQLTNWYVRFNRKRIKVSNKVHNEIVMSNCSSCVGTEMVFRQLD